VPLVLKALGRSQIYRCCWLSKPISCGLYLTVVLDVAQPTASHSVRLWRVGCFFGLEGHALVTYQTGVMLSYPELYEGRLMVQ
jgi:hypothetical protein